MNSNAKVNKKVELQLDRDLLLGSIQSTAQVLSDYCGKNRFTALDEFLIQLQSKLTAHLPEIIAESDPVGTTDYDRMFTLAIDQDKLTAFVQMLAKVISNASSHPDSHEHIISLSSLLELATEQMQDNSPIY